MTDPEVVERPPATLIVCSRGRPELLSSVVASVLASRELPEEFIVIDQSVKEHPDLPSLAVDGCVFRYVHSRSVGLSRSRNLGIAAASHPVIVFTDDDVLVPPEWFGILTRSLAAAGPRSVVTGRVLASDPESPGAYAPSLHPGTERAVYEGRVYQDPLATFNIAMPRDAHAAAGGFDPRLGPGTPFPAAEDNDFGYRLLEAGYRIVFDPEATVFHRAWREDRSYVGLRHGYGRGQGAFFAKHVSFDDRYMLRRLVGTLVGHIRRLPRAAINDLAATAAARSGYWRSAVRSSGSRTLTVGELAWIGGFLSGFVEWLATYRRRR